MTMSKNKSSKGKERQLPANYQLGRLDVLCCRGKIALEHEGNCRFRAMVQTFLPQYAQSNCKLVKSRIVSSIVDAVRNASPEGGFVKFVDEGWIVVSDRFAREKVGQTFRDLLHAQYKSSTKAKARARNSPPSHQQQPLVPQVPLHVKPSYVSSSASCCTNGELPTWVGSCPLPAQTTPRVQTTPPHPQSSLIPLSVASAAAAPSAFAQLPATESLANHALTNTSTCTNLKSNGGHPTPSNFLEQLIQGLDRSSSPGAHAEFENCMMKPLSTPSVVSGALPVEESSTTTGTTKPPRHHMSAESSNILSDLEPAPLLNDLRNSSAVFSMNAFRWEPRP